MPLSYFNGLSPMLRDPLGTGGGVNALIDASTEKIAFIGNVFHPTVRTGTIAIRKIHFPTGAVSINAASEVRVSLQDVSQTAGPPWQPDGVQDQFYDFKTATQTLGSGAWMTTGNLSADRTVNMASDSAGDTDSRRLAVVFEYQVFTAADSTIIRTTIDSLAHLETVGVVLNTGTYALLNNRVPVVVFECSDGTFAFLAGGVPYASNSSLSVNSTGAVRRAGVKFKFPFSVAIDRLAMSVRLPNGADGRVVLYDSDGTTELRSVNFDNDDVASAVTDLMFEFPIEPVTLLADTYYRLAYVGGTVASGTVNFATVNAAAHLDNLVLGQNAHWTQHNGTSWSDTTTQRPFFGLGIAAIDTGLAANPLAGFLA